MAKRAITHDLSRRERQIMEVIYQRGQATAAEVADLIPDPPSYSAVRALLSILGTKGFVRHEQEGVRYVFLPTLGQRSCQAFGPEGHRPHILQRLGRANSGRASRPAEAVR